MRQKQHESRRNTAAATTGAVTAFSLEGTKQRREPLHHVEPNAVRVRRPMIWTPMGSPWAVVVTGTAMLGRPMWLVRLAQPVWSKKLRSTPSAMRERVPAGIVAVGAAVMRTSCSASAKNRCHAPRIWRRSSSARSQTRCVWVQWRRKGGPWARVLLVQVTRCCEFGRARFVVGGGRRGGVEELLEEAERVGEADRPHGATDVSSGGGKRLLDSGESIGRFTVDGTTSILSPHRHAELADCTTRRGQIDAPGAVLCG